MIFLYFSSINSLTLSNSCFASESVEHKQCSLRDTCTNTREIWGLHGDEDSSRGPLGCDAPNTCHNPGDTDFAALIRVD